MEVRGVETGEADRFRALRLRPPPHGGDRRARARAATAIERDGDPCTLAIGAGDDGPYAGDVTIWTDSHEHRQGEIGYVLHPDFHGRGSAAGATRPLLELAYALLDSEWRARASRGA